MTVHIGRVTSEVRSTAPGSGAGAPEDDDREESPWEEQLRIAAIIERTTRDRRRTTTGWGDD